MESSWIRKCSNTTPYNFLFCWYLDHILWNSVQFVPQILVLGARYIFTSIISMVCGFWYTMFASIWDGHVTWNSVPKTLSRKVELDEVTLHCCPHNVSNITLLQYTFLYCNKNITVYALSVSIFVYNKFFKNGEYQLHSSSSALHVVPVITPFFCVWVTFQ